ncbi:hypothetical protein CXF95_25755 [Paraglaciecola sp. MB-3u-78]|nr:hypothetical protein CXF95_25755 [Paraglaciecola sp. MB-3u-78]
MKCWQRNAGVKSCKMLGSKCWGHKMLGSSLHKMLGSSLKMLGSSLEFCQNAGVKSCKMLGSSLEFCQNAGVKSCKMLGSSLVQNAGVMQNAGVKS